MAVTIKSSRDVNLSDLYKVMENIYGSSSAFSEEFLEKYPSIDRLESEIKSVDESDRHWVAVSDGKICGFLFLVAQSASKLRHTAFFSMGVASGCQGRGIGSALLEHMIENKSNDTEIIYLMVRADNQSAIRLYEKFQFSDVALLPNDTKIGDQYFDGLLMSRSFL